MEQINYKWLFGFLKTNKYSLSFPCLLSFPIFFVLQRLSLPIPDYILFGFVFCLCFLCWFFKLFKIPHFKEKEIGILIVFPTVPQLYDEIKLISDELFRLISSLNIQNVNVKFTRNNLFLNKENEIQKVLLKTKASIVVYAEFRHDTRNNEDICHFRQIKFLTPFPEGVLSLQKDIEQSFYKIPMGYFLRDTLGQRDKVVENVCILSTALLSNALRAWGQIDKAQELLFNLRKDFPQIKDNPFIKKNLAICKLVQCQDLYYLNIYRKGVFNIDKELLQQLRLQLIQAYELYGDSNIFLLLSVVNFLLGEEKKSWANIQRVCSRSSKGNYAANFSYSFLFCFNDNIIDAKRNLDKFYNDVEALPIHSDGLWHMIHFTEYVLLVHPEKYCLYFHLSNIYRLVSFNIALEKMQKFLEECKIHAAPSRFIKLAEETISFYRTEISVDLQK